VETPGYVYVIPPCLSTARIINTETGFIE
jgi:hypothetical protein